MQHIVCVDPLSLHVISSEGPDHVGRGPQRDVRRSHGGPFQIARELEVRLLQQVHMLLVKTGNLPVIEVVKQNAIYGQ